MICESCGESKSPFDIHEITYLMRDSEGILRRTATKGNFCHECIGRGVLPREGWRPDDDESSSTT